MKLPRLASYDEVNVSVAMVSKTMAPLPNDVQIACIVCHPKVFDGREDIGKLDNCKGCGKETTALGEESRKKHGIESQSLSPY